MYLIDTDVVSELCRAHPDRRVLEWLHHVPDAELFLSAVTVGELQSGIEQMRGHDPERAAAIELWLDQIAETFNILAMDARSFRIWAELLDAHPDASLENAMIAATAIAYNLTIVTRDTGCFGSLGLPALNPFDMST